MKDYLSPFVAGSGNLVWVGVLRVTGMGPGQGEKMSNFPFTVGDLHRQLKNLDPNDILEFQGGLTFNRIKRRGEDLQVLEFCEASGYLEEGFKERNPHVQVAFITAEPFEEGELVQEIDVCVR